jgi:hypothetical protein
MPCRQRSNRRARPSSWRPIATLAPEILPGFVEAQRLRDAALAEAALAALEAHGAPVAIITGNGHARRDWGVPAVLAVAAPGRIGLHAGPVRGAAGGRCALRPLGAVRPGGPARPLRGLSLKEIALAGAAPYLAPVEQGRAIMLAGKRILLIIGGGIAAYKSLDLIRRLRTRAHRSCRC